jgi:aromatic amino acid aminotransferase I
LINLRMEYTKRRDLILAACEKYLPKDLVSWNPPMAGMFVSYLITTSWRVLSHL